MSKLQKLKKEYIKLSMEGKKDSDEFKHLIESFTSLTNASFSRTKLPENEFLYGFFRFKTIVDTDLPGEQYVQHIINAHENGCAEATYTLIYIYKGSYTFKERLKYLNESKAILLMEKGTRDNNCYASYLHACQVSSYLDDGHDENSEERIKKVYELADKCLEQKHITGYYLKGCLAFGWLDDQIDNELSFKTLKAGYDLPKPSNDLIFPHIYHELTHRLASLYWDGTGTDINKKVALKLMVESANGDCFESIEWLYEHEAELKKEGLLDDSATKFFKDGEKSDISEEATPMAFFKDGEKREIFTSNNFSAPYDNRYKFLNPEKLSIYQPNTETDSWEQLNKLIGLEGIKKQLKHIQNRIEFDKKRSDIGFKNDTPSNHFVFSGNPGTGKNEVARILGNLLLEIGVLSKGHVIEVDRSDLAMGYVGQSAIKTREVIEEAAGGILFIDEAYTLNVDDDWGYSEEIIATIIKEMEDKRDDIIFIFAGYKDEMKMLLKSNPGFQSRVRHKIEFDDYSTEELKGIYQKFCNENDYILHKNTDKGLEKLFKATAKENRTEFGNGRFVRNAFEKTLEKMASRVIELELGTAEDLTTIIFSDIPSISEVTGKKEDSYKSTSDKIAQFKPKDDKD